MPEQLGPSYAVRKAVSERNWNAVRPPNSSPTVLEIREAYRRSPGYNDKHLLGGLEKYLPQLREREPGEEG